MNAAAIGAEVVAADACSERFDDAAALERRFGLRMTTLEAFVQRRVDAACGG